MTATPPRLRVLTWNMFHGRAVPPAGRDLFDEFESALAEWRWDIALLQEVPPWWPASLGSELGADHRMVPTSRNAFPVLRRAVATRWPDLIKSNGGGCNAILIREGEIAEERTRRLCWLPERRWVHGVRLADAGGIWVCNLHTASDPAQGRLAAEAALDWAGGRLPVVLGGDFNVRGLSLDGYTWAGGHGVDQVFIRGLGALGEAEKLDHGRLSDHAPVAVTVQLRPQGALP